MSITPDAGPPQNGPLRRAAHELSEAADSVSHLAKAGTGRVAEAFQSSVGRLRGGARRYAEETRTQLETTRNNAMEAVREKPATSAIAMFGLGLLAGAALMGVAARTLPGGARAGAQAAIRKTTRRLHS